MWLGKPVTVIERKRSRHEINCYLLKTCLYTSFLWCFASWHVWLANSVSVLILFRLVVGFRVGANIRLTTSRLTLFKNLKLFLSSKTFFWMVSSFLLIKYLAERIPDSSGIQTCASFVLCVMFCSFSLKIQIKSTFAFFLIIKYCYIWQ